jgi:hypothetical protein
LAGKDRPAGWFSVVDRLGDEHAEIEIRLLDLLRLVHMSGSSALLKGELMRYLAELAWAPSAILHNPRPFWDVIDASTFRVSTASHESRAAVELTLNADGRIASVFAPDRPRKEGNRFVERPWHGRFFDYRAHLGNWLPFRGEVGWTVDGQSFVVWRGELTSWTLV